MPDARVAVATPLGDLTVTYGSAGVSRIHFGRAPGAVQRPDQAGTASPAGVAAGQAGVAAGQAGVAGEALDAALRQLTEYFSGQRRSFELRLDWGHASRLQRQVLGELFESVRYGETVSYGELARRVRSLPDGADLPARAIGRIMGSNPLPIIVPCHRVVAGDGLGGYSGGAGPELKRWLLIFEGGLPPTLDWDPAGPTT